MNLDEAIAKVRKSAAACRGNGTGYARRRAREWDAVRKYLEELKALREGKVAAEPLGVKPCAG